MAEEEPKPETDGGSGRLPHVLSWKTNPSFLQEMKDGKTMLGCAVGSGNPILAELVASQGYDFVLIDAQHSPLDYQTTASLFQAVKAGGAKSWIRVGGPDDRQGIQQAFDLGVDGVMVPYVNSKEDVEKAVSVSKYPGYSAGGTRSAFINLRPQLPGGFGALFDYAPVANDHTMMCVQIETAEALECVEDICTVEGLDIAFIGPGDLAASMGLMKEVGVPQCWNDPRFGAACVRVAEACKKGGKIAGMWNSDVKTQAEMGFRFLVVDGDIQAMQDRLATKWQDYTTARAEIGASPKYPTG